jgi:hypothetical protein
MRCVIESNFAGKDGPDDSSHFVGQCNRRLVLSATGNKGEDPPALSVIMSSRPADHGAGAMDHRRSQAAVAALGDCAEMHLTAGAVFSRHQSESGCALMAVGKLMTVADGSQQGRTVG